MTTTAADLVTFLHKRGPMLARLAAAPTDQATLTETVSVSRTTVDRALDSFEEWGLIAADADRLEPTLFARLVLTVYDDFEADVMAAAPHEAGGAPLWRTTAERSDALGLVADHLDLLEYAQSPREKRALVTELPAARSTVNWAVRELEGAGLMQRTAAGYTTTPLGQRLTPRYRTLLATLTDLLAARDLLAHLPADCAFAPSLFTGTVIERADTATPYRLLEGLRERLATADQVRILLPALSNPQLLDMCHHQVVRHGATLELITDPALAETLTSEFPGPLVEMAAAATGTFTASVAETPSFGLVLVETDAGPSVSLLVYSDNQTMEGAFHAATDAALAWAEDYYEHVQSHATETTTDWVDAAEPTGHVALAAVADPGRVEREAEGFVQLTAEYFANRTAAPPATAWRTGFDLVDVHAGYAIDRQPAGDSEPTHQTLTDDLLTRLSDGTDHALLGAPGSGKSTVCKSVACRWYEQGRGAVFYRASGTGTTFGSPPLFSAQLRATEGQTLVVVEDAVRAEANAIFREAEDRKGRVRGCRYHGIIARKRGDIDAAKDHLRDALTHCREVGYDYHEGKTLIELGELARGQDNPERARDQFADAVEIYRDMGAIRDAIESLERLAKICETLDDEAAALTHYEAAAAIVEETEFIEPREALTERCATLTDTARDTDGN